MIRAIVFDMDGLMIDTEELYWQVGRALAAEYGRTVSDHTLLKMTGRDRLVSSQVFAEETGVPLSGEEVMHRREAMMLDRFRRGGLQPMPGLREILDRFRGRLKLGVATSSPRVLVEAALPALEVHAHFDAITAGDEIVSGKPNPEIYLKTMDKLGVKPAECVVLEDAPLGATAGKAAGAYVIAVPSRLTTHANFTGIADQRVADLLEAADRIEALLAPEPKSSQPRH
jgi:HAD superfamily hydrolase (TIGR01509 family)